MVKALEFIGDKDKKSTLELLGANCIFSEDAHHSIYKLVQGKLEKLVLYHLTDASADPHLKVNSSSFLSWHAP